ncbi:protein SICKLE-like [Henckelia pumila]|uniref:protein SICKLE-like n=1 Tax=Henckelia pumila TaxID=405737 RepID=UPI003C6E3DC8
MEESEKRRERLKAMRMQAAEADISIDSEGSGIVSRSLSNPLIENELAPSTAEQYSRPRFDYYTDPLSAFSADKRRSNFSHQVSHGYSSMPPNTTSSPGQRPTQAPGDGQSSSLRSSSLRNPIGVAGPLGKPEGNTSNTLGGSYSSLNYNYPPNMPDVNFPNSGVGRGDAPHAVHGWGRGGRYSNSPRPQLQYLHGSPNMLDVNFPNSGVGKGDSPHAVHGWGRGGGYSNSPRPQLQSHHGSPNMLDVDFPNSGVGGGDSPHAVHGWGRGGRYSNIPRPQLHSHHDSRHGTGRYSDWGRVRGRSPGLGPSARRGNSQDPVSAELRPDLYYDEEMFEDPWKGMTPVIWKGPNSDRSWLPKFLSFKKARPSPEASHKSVSQPSLAEYLATLNDTVNDPTHEEHEQSEVRES